MKKIFFVATLCLPLHIASSQACVQLSKISLAQAKSNLAQVTSQLQTINQQIKALLHANPQYNFLDIQLEQATKQHAELAAKHAAMAKEITGTQSNTIICDAYKLISKKRDNQELLNPQEEKFMGLFRQINLAYENKTILKYRHYKAFSQLLDNNPVLKDLRTEFEKLSKLRNALIKQLEINSTTA